MRRALQFLLVTLLAACGDNGGEQASETGALSIEITGLPADTKGDILLTGPQNLAQEISVAKTFSGLPPGDYTVKATGVLDGTSVFEPRQATQTITLRAGAEAKATVAYEAAGTLRLALQPVIAGVDQPLFLTAPPGDRRLFIAERPGRIRLFKDGVLAATPVLDISGRVSTAGEGGLLSIAFDPQFATNGFLYVHFTDPTGDVAVERFRMSTADPDAADPASAVRIITVEHRTFSNHKGGRAAFGLDGLLYLSVGDGGGGGDPFNAGQSLNTLLGKLVRIDPSSSNPQPEIWAYGLRNPWRFAFDRTGGNLYIADVGQNAREEVNAVSASTAGLNYGWNLMEGLACFAVSPCNVPGLTLPVLDYGRDASGGCSVIGGFVYRGNAIPQMRGRYFYSDLCSGWLRSFRFNGSAAVEQVDWNIANVGSVYSFGEDAQGELYLLATSNIIYKVVRQ